MPNKNSEIIKEFEKMEERYKKTGERPSLQELWDLTHPPEPKKQSFSEQMWSFIAPNLVDQLGTAGAQVINLFSDSGAVARGQTKLGKKARQSELIGTPSLRQSVASGLEGASIVSPTPGVRAIGTARGILPGLGKGIFQGVKTGALTGALAGTGQGVGADESVGEIAGRATGGAIAGGALGGVLGALTGPVQGGITRYTQPANLDEALDITAPVFNKKESIAAFEAAGQPGGVKVEGFLSKYKLQPSRHDIEVAQSVQNIVSPSKGPLSNIANISSEISKISESEIRPFLIDNPSIFNVKQLNAFIRDSVDLPVFIKSDETLKKTYDLTRQTMLKELDNFPKTMEGLWDARKSFDKVAEKQVGGLDPFSEKATVIRQAVLDTRRAVNEYIAQNTPNGGDEFLARMRLLSNMYEARHNLAETNYRLLNKNVVERFIKQNPALWQAILVGGGALGFGSLFGVGGTVLASQ